MRRNPSVPKSTGSVEATIARGDLGFSIIYNGRVPYNV